MTMPKKSIATRNGQTLLQTAENDSAVFKNIKISFQPVKSAAEHLMHLFPCAGIGEKNILKAVTR